MKQIIVAVAVIIIIVLITSIIILNNKSTNQELNNEVTISGDGTIDNNVETIEETPDYSNMSFEERTKEVREYMDKDNGYGMLYFYNYSYPFQMQFIENASLEKKDSYYNMKVQFASPKIYNKEDIEEACRLAQENGSYTFDGYTFYKDNKGPISIVDYKNHEDLLNENGGFVLEYDYYTEDSIFTTCDFEESEGSICFFRLIPSDTNKYYVYQCDGLESHNMEYDNDINRYLCVEVGETAGWPVFDIEKEMEIVLLPSDKMTITYERDYNDKADIELTVEEYYQKAINDEIIPEGSYMEGFKYSLSSIGLSMKSAYEGTDAVNFEKGCININYRQGGL